MDVFLNELSLTDRNDFDKEDIIFFLHKNLSILSDNNLQVYSRLASFKDWEEDCELNTQEKTIFLKSILHVDESPNNNAQSYYYYFKHQDFDLSVGNNIGDSSIAVAADKVISMQETVILNILNCFYSPRPHLPILKSSFDYKIKDELANIPCFNNAKDIIHHIFLIEKVKLYLQDDNKFEEFSKAYYKLLHDFDFTNWQPKSYKEGSKLIQEVAFPASSIDFFKNELSTWKVNKSTTGDNITNYKIVGAIVLELNGYVKNFKLTGHYGYEIYEAGYGNSKLLISIDVENGAFEVIDSDGTHIGVYGYAGNYLKHYTKREDISAHSLLNIPRNMFLFK